MIWATFSKILTSVPHLIDQHAVPRDFVTERIIRVSSWTTKRRNPQILAAAFTHISLTILQFPRTLSRRRTPQVLTAASLTHISLTILQFPRTLSPSCPTTRATASASSPAATNSATHRCWRGARSRRSGEGKGQKDTPFYIYLLFI